jgi:cytochrome c554/c'-like protein
MRHGKHRFDAPRSLVLIILSAFYFASFVVAQSPEKSPATIADQLSTSEHVRKPGWWPTKGTFARQDFVGTDACSRCHADIVATQKDSAMARTATLAANSAILRAHSLEQQRGPFTYRASVVNDAATYSVTDGAQSITGLLTWAFGIRMGQSFFFDHNGHTYLVPLTFYPEPKVYSLTVDEPHAAPDSLQKAIGRPLSEALIQGCFDCHTTGATTSGHFDSTHAMPGVTCEACHGPGADHLAAAKSGLLEQGTTLILNPQHMKPVEAVDFCGACHRTWWDVTLGDAGGTKSLRFQPYRIENSRCWGKGDARITCTGCHDPHKPLVREAATYDARCLSCHVNGSGAKPTADHPGPPCPTSTKNCVTCHMPQYQVVDIPVKFTDHQIRVVRAGDPIPE